MTRGEEGSCTGELQEMITGGGIAVRLLDGRAKSVPPILELKDVEILRFMSVTALVGEHADACWWVREDQLTVRDGDDGYAAAQLMKRTWQRINKEALPTPLYAPRFPRSALRVGSALLLLLPRACLHACRDLGYHRGTRLTIGPLSGACQAHQAAHRRAHGAHTHTRTHAHARLCRLSAPVTRFFSLNGGEPATAGAAAHQAAHMHAHKLSLSYLSHVHALYQLSLSLLPLLPL